MADTKQEDGKGKKEGGELMVVGYVTGSPFLSLVIISKGRFSARSAQGLASRSSRRIDFLQVTQKWITYCYARIRVPNLYRVIHTLNKLDRVICVQHSFPENRYSII